MTTFQALILGIVQGLTEFLPVSSSAHLVLTPLFLGWELDPDYIFIFDVLVQIGTLLAVIAYFWKDLLSIIRGFLSALFERKPFATADSRLGWYIILATIPAGLIGLALDDVIEAAFHSPAATAIFLIITAAMMFAAESIGKRTRQLDSITWKDALLMGFAQALAVFPGISRSGSTISAGMAANLDRKTAARFSFLMSIPIMLAAGLLSCIKLLAFPNLGAFIPVILTGFISSAIVGYLSIHWLLSYLNRHSLKTFSIYCLCISILTLLFVYVF